MKLVNYVKAINYEWDVHKTVMQKIKKFSMWHHANILGALDGVCRAAFYDDDLTPDEYEALLNYRSVLRLEADNE